MLHSILYTIITISAFYIRRIREASWFVESTPATVKFKIPLLRSLHTKQAHTQYMTMSTSYYMVNAHTMRISRNFNYSSNMFPPLRTSAYIYIAYDFITILHAYSTRYFSRGCIFWWAASKLRWRTNALKCVRGKMESTKLTSFRCLLNTAAMILCRSQVIIPNDRFGSFSLLCDWWVALHTFTSTPRTICVFTHFTTAYLHVVLSHCMRI